ncbi:MAG: DNA cytosine methyltransferase [Rhodobacteraceae bacterium]|nr:DNA cytosine methyltransferase [Paracoccaceae bacterium]
MTTPSIIVDLFCGAGGLSYGFKNQGFEISAGIDIDENCRYPYQENIEAPFIRTDVTEVTREQLLELFDPHKIKILVGCAPCQPFSKYNQKNSDPNWKLLESFGRLISEVKPEIVSMENVPQLKKFKDGAILRTFIDTLNKAGYHISFDTLFAPNYGLPQSRSRLVLLASLLGPISLPAPTHKEQHVTVRDALSDLPALSAGSVDDFDNLHRSGGLSDLNIKRIKASVQGGSWHDWPEKLVAKCHKSETGKGYRSVYGRMSWDKPSPTITTQFYGFGNGRFGHPDQDRAISLREGAILQGFPRDYKFVPAGEKVRLTHVGKMIGNAVPVTLANAIASAVKLHLEEHQNV